MNTFVVAGICLFFIIVGIILAVFAKTIVSWLYTKTMDFWSQRVNPERKEYTDKKYQSVWYWKMWWLWSLWTYRIIGFLVSILFLVLLIVFLSK